MDSSYCVFSLGNDEQLPLKVRSVGHKISGASAFAPKKTDCLGLMWTISGKARYHINGQELISTSDTLLIHVPGDRVEFKSMEHPWERRWISFLGPLASLLPDLLGLPCATILNGISPHPEPLEEIKTLIENFSLESEYKASILAYQLLLNVSNSVRIRTSFEGLDHDHAYSLIKRSLAVINRKFTDTAFGVDLLAAELNIHRVHLYRIFIKTLGLSPSEYIRRKRTQTAIALLQNEKLSIKEIAACAGFSNPVYFSKFVKAQTGSQPRMLRHSV